jgi:hypothetical protein
VRAVDLRTGRLDRIVRSRRSFSLPPPAVRKARLDNLALVPASLLPYKKEQTRPELWVHIASLSLRHGAVDIAWMGVA